MEKNISLKYYFYLFVFFPISIIIGPTISLLNLLLIDFFFIFFFFKKKDDFIFSHYSIKFLFILYIYLIFNSLISLNIEIGLFRNLGFIRIIIFFIAVNYYFYHFRKKNFLNYWIIILLIFLFDVFFEAFFGANIFGWGVKEIDGVLQPNWRRVMSFFKDEAISGAFLSAFLLMIFGKLLNKKSNNKVFAIIFLLIGFLGIILTGERANTIKTLIGIIIFVMLFKFWSIKKKLITLCTVFFLIIGLCFSNDYLHNRYIGQIFKTIEITNLKKSLDENIYYRLYNSGYSVFKKYPIFGVGNKNYRIETCKTENLKNFDGYRCMTHPHQIYFEFLSEHGLVGTLIMLGIFFYLIFKILQEIIITRNNLQIGCFIFVILTFIPLLPSGSFFSNFGTTLFWLNFSIMFACNKKTNIFSKKT